MAMASKEADLLLGFRWNTNVWVKYAQWEESQKDSARARSVWKRALEVDYRNPTLRLRYTEVEMKHKFINHARNVLQFMTAELQLTLHFITDLKSAPPYGYTAMLS
ncbi:hypothetical protein SUGI_0974290 [Cryptomeria japonica]|nr:hypothetical protein SUGI_0974290 [Cryptomeria japonica]